MRVEDGSVSVLVQRRTLVDEIIDGGGVRAVYQPIVELGSGAVVAYESLARGPVDTALERPDLLFTAAREVGRVADLDWACRAAAVRGALAAGLSTDVGLFVNVEPEALTAPVPDPLRGELADAGRLRLFVEVTERSLLQDPAGMLERLARIRELGWGVALDDVGACPDSLALMPFIRPDVVKLDLRLIQERPSREAATVLNAVRAYAEATGAVVLAEGIETEAHADTARAMGATLGQGWLFARPGPLPAAPAAVPARPLLRLPDAPAIEGTPFEHVHRQRTTLVARKDLLLAMSRSIEENAAELAELPVVLSTFQHAKHFTPASAERYRSLARRSAFVAGIGVGMPVEPVAGVRGAVVHPADPLVGEWDVVVVSPHFAAALVATDLGDTGPDGDRRFEYVITYDRELVLGAARRLLARVAPKVT